MRTVHPALFYSCANACCLFGREGDVQRTQEVALDAFPVQEPATARIWDRSAASVVEEHLPGGVVCVSREQVLLRTRVLNCVRWLSPAFRSRAASRRGSGSLRLRSGATSKPHPVLQEIAGGKHEGKRKNWYWLLVHQITVMHEHDSSIELFNVYVIGQVSKLHARGEQTQDLLVNLFKGYKACKDAEFVDYIKKKEDFYEEGGQVEYQQLMDRWALNKYKTRKESEQWRKSAGGTRKDQKKANMKGKSKGKLRPEDRPAWMKTPPKDGEKQSKTVEGNEYHWCQHHEAWTRNKPSECKGIGFTKTQGKDLDKSSDSKPKMKLSKALAAITSDDE
ncbi:hypothetical protein MHU86_6973 [Fragilaria crotonensis]|nr:hypothetical protein MHU86_6973 [Fragilaria crotonensis]